MKYYTQQSNVSIAGIKYTKLVKANNSPLLQKSASGTYFTTIVAPDGNRYAVIVHQKGTLKPYRNEDRLPKAIRRHRIKVA